MMKCSASQQNNPRSMLNYLGYKFLADTGYSTSPRNDAGSERETSMALAMQWMFDQVVEYYFVRLLYKPRLDLGWVCAF